MISKVLRFVLVLVFFVLCGCHTHHYQIYRYDNGNDYASDGLVRIIDTKTGKIGYATTDGKVVIAPQFSFGFPFHNGVAKVTHSGHHSPVHGSDGEYHSFESDHWFYIDKQGYEVKR